MKQLVTSKMVQKARLTVMLFCALFFTHVSYSQSLLEANCSNSDAYGQIEDAGYGLELPDCGHPVKHITVRNDSELGKCVFAFTIHRDLDDDRCSATDRQRLEIKMNDASTVNGTTRTHQWKFKLDAGFKPGSSFFHIHQIKAQGGSDEGSPMITLTTRAGSPEKMQLIYTAPSGQSGSGTVYSTDLAPFKGTWVQVTEVIKYSSPGTYSINIKRISDGATLFNYSSTSLRLTRSGAGLYRPKYGLYRSLNNKEVLRDETVLFADFCFSKGTAKCYSDPGGQTPTVPTAPGNLSASVASCSQINLTWSDNSSNESNFRIQRSSDGSTWSDLATVAANTTSYSNTGLAENTRYYYRVCALNSAGSSAYTSSVNATTTSCNVTVQKIWLEAENGTLSSPMASYSDATASGGRYIMAPSGTNSSSSAPSSGYSTLSFSVNSAGSYKLWFRTIMATTSTNSFYYRIDGGSWVSWNVDANVSTAWQWNSVATLTLSAGSHTLTIAYREGGTKLDRILLTNDAAYVPTGMGEGTPTTYDNIALEAENGTLSSPMASYTDANASSGSYIMAPSGTNSSSSAPSSGYSTLSFTAAGGSYKLWFRTIMATTSTNSFYYRIDGGSWVSWNVDANVSTAWKWNLVSSSLTLSAGSHTLTIAYREGGTKLDMIAISNDPAYNPSVLKSAKEAVTVATNELIISPNPVTEGKAQVKYNVPNAGKINAKLYTVTGKFVMDLVDKDQEAGEYTIDIDASQLPGGAYIIKLASNSYVATAKIVVK